MLLLQGPMAQTQTEPLGEFCATGEGIVQGSEPDCWHSSHSQCGSPSVDPSSGGEVARVLLHEAGSTNKGDGTLHRSSQKGRITPAD
jgi:hypothetical protein